MTDHAREIRRRLEQLTDHGHRLSEVFTDWVACCAYGIASASDMDARLRGKPFEEREESYLRIQRKYPKGFDLFSEALGELVFLFEEGPSDHLGKLFMDIGSPNDRLGQFFTPYELSRTIAHVSLVDIEEHVARKGYITIGEPACGSGGMVIAAAEVMLERGLNPQRKLVVHAQDLSTTAVHMAYVQLSLMGLPALVVHGDTLRMQTFSEWRTMMWSAGAWDLRRPFRQREDSPPAVAAHVEPVQAQPDIVVKDGQLTLFGGQHGL